MGDGQNGALESLQILLQPFGGSQVQVVGRLVQQEDIGILQNEPSQVNPSFLTAGQFVEGPFSHFLGNRKTVAHFIFSGVSLVTAPRLKGSRQPVVLGQQCRIILPCRHPLGKLLHLLFQLLEGSKSSIQYVLHSIPWRINGDLRNQPHPPVWSDDNLTLVWVDYPCENTQKSSLTAPVGSKQTDAFSSVHLKGKPIQYFFADLKFFY